MHSQLGGIAETEERSYFCHLFVQNDNQWFVYIQVLHSDRS